MSKRIRKSIPARVRFEVFKRDSFKCQYCGACAPDVLLQIDHIKAVSDGGDNDITNLLTACESCNGGKSNIPLDENATVNKMRTQLEDLQERRAQLEMMMEWKRGLRDIAAETVQGLCAYWQDLAPGFIANEHGQKLLRSLLRRFSVDEITESMNVSADKYLAFDGTTGKVTRDSWAIAFQKIGGICVMRKKFADDPDLGELFYIRGILNRRFDVYEPQWSVMKFLKTAFASGISLDDLKEFAREAHSYNRFKWDVEKAILEIKS